MLAKLSYVLFTLITALEVLDQFADLNTLIYLLLDLDRFF